MAQESLVDVKKLANLYRRAKSAADPNLIAVAENAMVHAMEVEAAHSRMMLAEAMVAETLDLTSGPEVG